MSDTAATCAVKLKYIATLNDEALGADTDADYEIQYIDIGNVDSSGKIGDVASYRFEDAPSRARRRVRDGDVIISTVRTYLQAIAQIRDPPGNLIASTGFAVVRPRSERFAAEYCRYALREPSFLAEVEKRSVGVSYPAINSSDLASIPVHIHSLPRQRAIAEHLDRETRRIDKLIAAKQRLLVLLEEKREALITRAVTRGVDPDVTLRDSAVPWLGAIPAHWDLRRGKWLFSERDDRSADGEQTLLSLRMHRGLVPHNEVSEKQTSPEKLVGYKRASPGEIVVNRMRAAIGLIAVTPEEGLVSPDYAVFVPSIGTYVDYYGLLFRTELLGSVFRSVSSGMGTGTQGFLRLYSESFLALWFPSPPESEQREIVEYIEGETAKLDGLREAAEKTIALSQERRSALIAAAVTGQIDVEAAA